MTLISAISTSHQSSYSRPHTRSQTQNDIEGEAARKPKEISRIATPTHKTHHNHTHSLTTYATASPAQPALGLRCKQIYYSHTLKKRSHICFCIPGSPITKKASEIFLRAVNGLQSVYRDVRFPLRAVNQSYFASRAPVNVSKSISCPDGLDLRA